MPVHPSHPDPEELAAWQAGDVSGPGGAHVEAHVAGCADCAGRVAAVERGRAALAGLAEVEPPAGLHGRLAAATASRPLVWGRTGARGVARRPPPMGTGWGSPVRLRSRSRWTAGAVVAGAGSRR